MADATEEELEAAILKNALIGGGDASHFGVSSSARTTATGRLASGSPSNLSRMPRGGGNNPFVTFDVSTSGIRETLYSLSATMTAGSENAGLALLSSAKRIQSRARTNVRWYKYTGRLHDAIQVHVSKTNTPNRVRVTVGIHSRTFAPEGATFERGWHSEKGLQPPLEPLALWARKKKIAKTEKEAMSVAYVISRRMGQQGYSFGTRPWLSTAFAAEAANVEPTVARYMLRVFSSQSRIPAGQAGAGRFSRG